MDNTRENIIKEQGRFHRSVIDILKEIKEAYAAMKQ